MQNIFDQVVYFAFFQSLLLLLVYLFSPKNRKKSNPYLIFLIFAIFLGLSGRVLYMSEVLGQNRKLFSISEFAGLLYGVSLYLFIRTSLRSEKPKREHLWHYLPALGYMVFLGYYYLFAPVEVIRERILSGEFGLVVYLLIGIALTINICYWIFSLKTLLNYKGSLKNEMSFSVKTRFLMNLHLAVGMCFLAWLIIYLISLFGLPMLERNIRPYIWLSLAFIMLFISYYALFAPEVFHLPDVKSPKKYTRSKLSIADMDRLKQELDVLMETKKPYLNNRLMKAELAEMLGVSNPELARLLNERIGMNFFEYVNYFRIKEFVEMAKSNKAGQYTLFGLAQEVGFNSKATFNGAFKKLMGTTPSNYFNTVKTDR